MGRFTFEGDRSLGDMSPMRYGFVKLKPPLICAPYQALDLRAAYDGVPVRIEFLRIVAICTAERVHG